MNLVEIFPGEVILTPNELEWVHVWMCDTFDMIESDEERRVRAKIHELYDQSKTELKAART